MIANSRLSTAQSLRTVAAACVLVACAETQEAGPPAVPAPPLYVPAGAVEATAGATDGGPDDGGAAAVAPPDATAWTVSYPQGSWVYASGLGWVWVPAGSETTIVEGVPYTYLYTPSWGWTWYVSPWGLGPYHYGGWVRRPYLPHRGFGARVAPPHVHGHLAPPPRFAPRPAPRGGGRHR